ncbi:MAG: hypothetical protein ACOZCL_15940 [Bacillota bacterium]
MLNSFKNEELVKVQGKTYPVVGGRLRLAHDENKLLSIETSILYYNEESVVVQAHVKTDKGSFSGIGNASVKRDRVLANAIIELAETRAIARSLRFAGYGVEFTGFEEVGESKNLDAESDNEGIKYPDEEDPKKQALATKAQINAIFSLAQSFNISNDELRGLMQDMTGKNYSKDLTKKDASSIISYLKQKESPQSPESH